MKGHDKVIAMLNDVLADELTAINQYMVHSEMCANWGYERLHKTIEMRAIHEMKHAEKLIARILFLEGTPVVSKLNEIHVGPDIEKQFRNDLLAEKDAIKTYNDAVRLTTELNDNGTRELIVEILEDEEEHLDWLEAQIDQITQIGLPNYLAAQIKEDK